MTNPTRGFTLIELIIAVALGSMVVLAAFSAFRTAASSLTISNRLAIQNAVMRQGLTLALDEIDMWRTCDDPDTADDPVTPLRDGQELRDVHGPLNSYIANADMPGRTVVGLPFSPFRKSLTFTAGLRPSATNCELAQGWDPAWDWPAADPRTWYLGNMVDQYHSDQRWGRYGMFTNQTQRPNLGNVDPTLNADEQRKARYSRMGMSYDPTGAGWFREETGKFSPHRTPIGQGGWRWQQATGSYGVAPVDAAVFRDRQITALRNALGFYGLLDYTPSNTIYAAYGAWCVPRTVATPPEFDQDSDGNPLGTLTAWPGPWLQLDEKIADEWVKPYHSEGENFGRHFMLGTVGSLSPRGRLSLSGWTSIGLNPVSPYTGKAAGQQFEAQEEVSSWAFRPTSTWTDERFSENHRVVGASLRDNANNFASTFLRTARVVVPVLPQRPASWPDAWYTVLRYLTFNRYVNLMTVRWADGRDGRMVELIIPAFGTTLRGARQQRHRDGGWARWDNAVGAVNDPTLDTP